MENNRVEVQVASGFFKKLVQTEKESGNLKSSIAVRRQTKDEKSILPAAAAEPKGLSDSIELPLKNGAAKSRYSFCQTRQLDEKVSQADLSAVRLPPVPEALLQSLGIDAFWMGQPVRKSKLLHDWRTSEAFLREEVAQHSRVMAKRARLQKS